MQLMIESGLKNATDLHAVALVSATGSAHEGSDPVAPVSTRTSWLGCLAGGDPFYFCCFAPEHSGLGIVRNFVRARCL